MATKKVEKQVTKEGLIQKEKKTKKNTSNRIGATLEHRVQKRFDVLLMSGLGIINKCHTEVKIIRGAGGRIVNVVPQQTTMVDFIGILKSRPICIETKTVAGKRLPFENIHEHQHKFMSDFGRMNGLEFFIVEFREERELYLVEGSKVREYIEAATRKSFPIAWFQENAISLEYDKVDIENYIENI